LPLSFEAVSPYSSPAIESTFAACWPDETAVLFVLEPCVISNFVRRYNRAAKAASIAVEPITTAFVVGFNVFKNWQKLGDRPNLFRGNDLDGWLIHWIICGR
jgi:hypothetical protein